MCGVDSDAGNESSTIDVIVNFFLFVSGTEDILEGRRFGVPFRYHGSTARVMRKDDMIYIYSADMKHQLITHDVTWHKRDRFSTDQYALLEQPEPALSIEKFNFDKEVGVG